MAYEKTWAFRLNQAVTGSGTVESYSQNWMFQLFSMLSGGNGNATAAWEILSASDASTVAAGGTNITASADFTFNNAGSAHSWFVARKSTMLPQTGSETRYVYFTADCENTLDYQAYFSFAYEIPSSAGSTTARPTEAGQVYAKDGQQYIPSTADAGNDLYFNGIIDTTGSFHVFSCRNATGKYNAPFALSCARLETPRTGTVDPFPVFMKCGYSDNSSYMGPWDFAASVGGSSCTWTSTSPSFPAAATWWPDGTDGTSTTYNVVMMQGPVSPSTYGPFSSYGYRSDGASVDNKYALMATYVWSNDGASSRYQQYVRGRLPDVHGASEYTSLLGMTTPATGTPTHSVVGAFWFPATASILPGA